MGFIAKAKKILTRSKRVEKTEDTFDPLRAARRGETAEEAAKSGQRSVRKVPESDIQAGLQKTLKDASTRYGLSAGVPIGLGGLGVGGAWAYTSQQKTQREKAQTERYEEYLNRRQNILQKYEDGEISEAERDRLLEKAEQNYRYQEDPDKVRSITQYLASLGTIKTLALFGVGVVVLRVVLKPIIRDMDFSGVIG